MVYMTGELWKSTDYFGEYGKIVRNIYVDVTGSDADGHVRKAITPNVKRYANVRWKPRKFVVKTV